MSGHYTQQEIEEIRFAFEGQHGRGLINEIVWTEYEKEHISKLDIKDLIDFFSSFKCGGVVRLINTINFPNEKGIFEFGSHCIDFYGVTKGAFSFENAGSLVGITIGSLKMQITPIEWLSYLTKGFDRLSKIQQSGFNDVCNDFGKLNEAVASGKGVRTMTHEEFFDL